MRVWLSTGLACAAALLVQAGGAFAQPAPPPPQQALAVTSRAVTWFDAGRLFTAAPGQPSPRLLESVPETWLPQLASSESAVAGIVQGGRFVGAIAPEPLLVIPPATPLNGGGCSGWKPVAESVGNFVVAGSDVVSAASATCPAAGATRQPLFIKNLRGGAWHVLRWLAGGLPPMLAAEGGLVAVGEQFSIPQMRVTIIDVRNGQTESRFLTPDGYLAFASVTQLVVSIGDGKIGSFPLAPFLQRGGSSIGGGEQRGSTNSGPYDLALYATTGRRLADLGTATEPPLVSHMQMIVRQPNGPDESGETLSLRNIVDGTTRPLIGFGTLRTLVTLAFRWPVLAFVYTTREALPASEVSCESGYAPEGSPLLRVLDLTQNEPFNPVPAFSAQQYQGLLQDCPFRPPEA